MIAGTLIKVSPSTVGFDSDAATDKAIQEMALVAFPLLLIAVPILDSLRRWSERKTLWPLVKEILEEFRKQIYPGSKDPVHLHRVTLFKRSRWVARITFFKKPRFGWLKIIESSGHTMRNSKTVFYAPNDPDNAEGIAGIAWASNTIIYKEELPDVKDKSCSEEKIREYSQASNTPIEMVKEKRPVSRSLCGIPVEVKGVVWGVLVVDSRQPQIPKDLIERHYALTAKFLSRILERL